MTFKALEKEFALIFHIHYTALFKKINQYRQQSIIFLFCPHGTLLHFCNILCKKTVNAGVSPNFIIEIFSFLVYHIARNLRKSPSKAI